MTSLLADASDASDDEDEQEPSTSSGLKINRDYATSYNRFREKEVFQKLKDKYGEDAATSRLEDDLDSTSSSEDEDAEALTEDVEMDFFKTLACLKGKDPRIYDGQTKFFKEPSEAKKKKDDDKKKDKPLYLRELERKVILEKEGKFDELEDEELARRSDGKTYAQELEDIKKSFKVTAKMEEEEEEDEDLLKQKKKTRQETAKDDADYKSWLAGQKEEVGDEETKKDLKGLRDFWNRKDLGADEKFLKDYILNRRFLADDNDGDDEREHGYDEVAHDSDEDLSEDEKNVQRMEEFEHKYNFRYEEPDPEFIKRYPRTVQESMRRGDNKRKEKREEVQERKRREKEQKQTELKQLKAMKKKEILGKLEKLKKISGSKDLAFGDEDIEGDFDPAAYDKRMAELFGKYDEVAVENEDERPEFSDLESDLEEELEVENWDEWEGHEEEEEEAVGVEDPNFVMDCDYQDNLKMRAQEELIDSTRGRKKRRKSKFAEVLEKKKPVFDPSDKTFEQYLDEYYKLDYEDIVGGIPCRFKYRSVEQNDFGLDTNEILSAPDRELNAWCSLKKTCQYRSREEEQEDVRLFRMRGGNWQLKKKMLPSLFEENTEEALEAEKARKASKNKRKRKRVEEEGESLEVKVEAEEEDKAVSPKKKRKKKKKAKKIAEEPVQERSNVDVRVLQSAAAEGKGKKKQKVAAGVTAEKPEMPSGSKKRKRQRVKVDKKNAVNADIKMSDERLKAYGLKPNQVKRKAKKQKYKE